jgi:mannose-6-phosphate isomerase-like protein (cupin superfamily)
VIQRETFSSGHQENKSIRMISMGEFKVTKLFIGFCILAAVSICAAPSAGQGKTPLTKASGGAPSTAAQAYLVMTERSIDDTLKALQSANKTNDLMTGDTLGCRVFIQHEKDVSTNQAEVHDGADDIFILMEGSATFILGGKLDSPHEVQPGEWRAADIVGGKEFKLNKGDMIVVPRGTPHRRVTAGMDVTLLVIKAKAPAAK